MTAVDADGDRVRGALATIPFLLIGLFSVLLILVWGADYLWGFLVVLPILFLSAFTWVAFKARK